MKKLYRKKQPKAQLDAEVLEAYIYKNSGSKYEARKLKRTLQKIMAF